MAALPTTSLTMTAIGTALGNASRNLSTLCTDSNINAFARYKPGYLDAGATADKWMFWQEPQGSGTTDPRGLNPDGGGSLEVFRMGDFRGYDHDSDPAYAGFSGTTIQFPNGTGTSSGISIPFYAEDVNWAADSSDLYREQHGMPELTHVLALDASDNSIQGAELIPAIAGNVDIDLDGVTLPAGTLVTKTYHIAFGVDATHWSVKLGTLDGAGGIGDVKMIQLLAPIINGVTFDDTSFTGGDNDPYAGCNTVGSNTNRFSGNTAIWDYSTLSAWKCFYTHDGGGDDDYRSIAATWYIKGFIENPATEYEVKTANFVSNGGNNTVDLSSMVDSPPRGYWKDGDNIFLILRDLTINF